jgi:hypothetical protein
MDELQKAKTERELGSIMQYLAQSFANGSYYARLDQIPYADLARQICLWLVHSKRSMTAVELAEVTGIYLPDSSTALREGRLYELNQLISEARRSLAINRLVDELWGTPVQGTFAQFLREAGPLNPVQGNETILRACLGHILKQSSGLSSNQSPPTGFTNMLPHFGQNIWKHSGVRTAAIRYLMI